MSGSSGRTRKTARPGKRQSGRWIWKPENSPFWQYDFTYGGRRYTGSTKTGNKREAEAVARDMRKKVIAQHESLRLRSNQSSRLRDMTLLAAVDRFVREKVKCDYLPASARAFETEINLMLDLIGDRTPITGIDDDVIARVVAKLRERFHTPPTEEQLAAARLDPSLRDPRFNGQACINKHLDSLRSVLIRARDTWKIPLPDMPLWKNHRRQIPTRKRYASAEEIVALRRSLRPDFRPVVEAALECGVRIMALVTLTWAQINWETRKMTVTLKGGAPKLVTITDKLAAILRGELGNHPTRVFTFSAAKTVPNRKTRKLYIRGQRYPMTYCALENMFRVACAKERLRRDLTLHVLRKTRGSLVLQATKSMVLAQEVMTHKDLKTTQRHYAWMDDGGAEEGNIAGTELLDRRVAEVLERERDVADPADESDENPKLVPNSPALLPQVPVIAGLLPPPSNFTRTNSTPEAVSVDDEGLATSKYLTENQNPVLSAGDSDSLSGSCENMESHGMTGSAAVNSKLVPNGNDPLIVGGGSLGMSPVEVLQSAEFREVRQDMYDDFGALDRPPQRPLEELLAEHGIRVFAPNPWSTGGVTGIYIVAPAECLIAPASMPQLIEAATRPDAAPWWQGLEIERATDGE